MPLPPSTHLGPYEIQEMVGAGGMGEVYRARDTRLDRTVAIKVLPSHIANREDLRRRFEREARTVAGLNHPHICALHDVGHQEGRLYLVMEYLEGETLEKRLKKGPLPMDQVLHYAIQIAAALDHAHRDGATHRDLKPGNVMLTKAGAKLLDFGLAKMTAKPSGVPGLDEVSALPTKTRALTTPGTVLGTIQYMAPEQLEGKEADARTDIFAFGAVLFEMATGKVAFEGSSQASLITKIMSAQPPPMSTVQPIVPPALEHVVCSCLEKDPDSRWQTAHDILVELKWIAEGGSQAGIPRPVVARRKTRELVSWVLAAALGLALIAVAAVHFRERPLEVHPVRFTVAPPDKVTFQRYDMPAVSPDGQRLVFTASAPRGMLWARPIDSLTARPLPGTEGAYFPFWSPDSRFVGFFAGGKLKKIDVSGGPAQTLCDLVGANGNGGTWNRDGVIVFARSSGPLLRVSASGGEAKPILELDKSRQEASHMWPYFLPDGRHFVYLARSTDAGRSGIRLGSLDSKETRPLISASSNASYVPPGYLVFGRQNALMAQPFDAKKLQLAGDPFPIADQVGSMLVWPGHFYSVSESGVLAYRINSSANVQLAWYNRDGERLGSVGEPGSYRQIVLSPDERQVAIERPDPRTGSDDIWLLTLSSGILQRQTFSSDLHTDPNWSPDGREVAFSLSRKATADLFRKAIGGGSEELIFESDRDKYPEQWLKDGSIVFINTNGKAFYRVALSGETKPEILFQSEFDKDEPHVSPDGRWIAYNSNESGRWEVYVASFPGFTGRRQVSNAGGVQALWRGDGKELFYLSLEGKLMAVEVKTGTAIETGPPKALFQTSVSVLPFVDQYCVTHDGQRFLFGEPLEGSATPITVVLNWAAGLKR
jgi:Tol biopolymer transport system component/predicted Ser/Thr protein kinase